FAWDRPVADPDSGVVSHASACQIQNLGDIPAPEVEISVPRRRTTTEPFVRLHTASVDAPDITIVDGLPVTTASRTIVDLLQARADGGHIGGVITEAERRDLINVDELAQSVQPFARKYGLSTNATGRDLIDHLVAQASESLRRQEVDRASQQGFDTAVQLLAQQPDLASFFLQKTSPHPSAIQTFLDALAQQQRSTLTRLERSLLDNRTITALASLQEKLQVMQKGPLADAMQAAQKLSQPAPGVSEALRKLSQPTPGLSEALRKLAQPDPAVTRALQQATALKPYTVRALEDTQGLNSSRKATEHQSGTTRQHPQHTAATDQESPAAPGDSRERPEEAD
ncbi:hypothetical protein ACWGJX_48235, partial [Streptomyces sp. NPDC054775]